MMKFHIRRPSRFVAHSLILLMALLLPVAAIAPVAAQTSGDATQSKNRNLIWEGLWAGANLELGTGFAGTQPAAGGAQTIANRQTSSGNYAALGDSVAAGIGLPTLTQVPSAYTRCGRTAEAYPNIVSARLSLPLNHIACSGATAGDLITKQRSGSPNLPSQLSTAFAAGKPQLITITAGANDAHWLFFLQYCYTNNCANGAITPSAADCTISEFTTTALANCYLAALQLKLVAAFSAIDLRSGGRPPTTIITGYYNPVSSACTAKYPSVTAAEISWLNAEVSALNQTIRQTAQLYPFVTYVPVDFSGHDICSADPWVQGLQAPQPFHPTATGQRVMANAVLTALGR